MHKTEKRRRYFFKGSRGLSTVVANLLLILLVMVAIGVVWVVISNILQTGAQSVNLNDISFSFNIKSAYVSGSNIVVSVTRNSGGGKITGIRLVFNNATNSVTIDKMVAMNELDTQSFTFTPSDVPGIGAGDTVSVAPLYDSSGGQQKVGQILDTAQISGTAPPGGGSTNNGGGGITGNPPYCGDGTVNQLSEQCDLGYSLNGQPGSGCNSDCTTEQSSSCNNNGTVDGTEVCDYPDRNGQTCQTQGYAGGGTLGCSNCQFDYSQCIASGPVCGNGILETGEACDQGDPSIGGTNGIPGSGCTSDCQIEQIPPACDGTWDQTTDTAAGIECDGTPLPNGCGSTCFCKTGFHASGSGTCAINSPLNQGTINSVWNNIFFDSYDLPKDSSVQNKYVNFSNSPETGCFHINFAAYVQQNDISYVRVDDSTGVPNIGAGQGYSIWQAANCGYPS